MSPQDADAPTRRPRVLVIAEAANPEWVSVPLVGWSLSRALGEVADVHVVTQVRNRDAFVRAGLVEGEDFTSIDTEALARPLWRLAQVLRMGEGVGWTMVSAVNGLGYGLFERKVWQRFGDRVRAGEFDLVHRVTPLTPTAHSPLARRCREAGVPFVLGPLNGGVPWPSQFADARRQEREWLSHVRGVYRLDPRRRRTMTTADAIVCGSLHTMGEIPAKARERCVWIPENAIDPARFHRRAEPAQDGVLRACFIGRLVPYKGADMALEACATLMREGRLTLDVVGDGPQAGELAALAERLGVVDQVTFHGWTPHEQVQEVAARSQLLVFPSVREFGGGVVLEAMALGVVPVVVDYAGPAELVDGTRGVKVPLGTRQQVVARLGEALGSLADEPARVAAMSHAARAFVEEHATWSVKAHQLRQVYDAVLDGRALPRPMSPAGP